MFKISSMFLPWGEIKQESFLYSFLIKFISLLIGFNLQSTLETLLYSPFLCAIKYF